MTTPGSATVGDITGTVAMTSQTTKNFAFTYTTAPYAVATPSQGYVAQASEITVVVESFVGSRYKSDIAVCFGDPCVAAPVKAIMAARQVCAP